jgi:micrococcal nuclease
MKRLILSTATVILLSFCIVGCAEPILAPSSESAEEVETLSTPERVQAKVVRVIDGDTIEVNISGSVYRVRYIGINTPEVGQWGADEATQANAQLVLGKTVELEKDVSETDQYGRLLRYVWVNTSMVNATLVANGYAQVATYPPDVKYQQEFLNLQRQAQEAGLGLWATQQPITISEGMFVGSINSDVYHYPTCTYAQRIYPENQIWFSSPEDAKAHGYRPCKVCRPP